MNGICDYCGKEGIIDNDCTCGEGVIIDPGEKWIVESKNIICRWKDKEYLRTNSLSVARNTLKELEDKGIKRLGIYRNIWYGVSPGGKLCKLIRKYGMD